jgi:ceramide glucosyltransferase
LLESVQQHPSNSLGFVGDFSDAAPSMNVTLGCLALLSLGLLLWQWLAAVRFPIHRRMAGAAFTPEVTLLKPLKGCEGTTRECLRSWLAQEYQAPLQILFGVASAEDPVCRVVEELLRDFPAVDAKLLVCGPLAGANLKVSKLAQLLTLAKHDLLVISDADVRVPADLLANLLPPFEKPALGLVNCFYRLANPATWGMKWEAIAVNADFWSQVLQSQTLKPLDFALGAVMATRRGLLHEIGGFEALADCLADDYQLGHRIARRGHRIVLSPVVVECWSDPMTFRQVWNHQLRWARTVRVCQPLPYFFSILSNPTLWPMLWLLFLPGVVSGCFAVACVGARVICAYDLQRRLAAHSPGVLVAMMAPLKDLLQTTIWLLAFAGNTIEWRGERMRLRRDGTLVKTGGAVKR